MLYICKLRGVGDNEAQRVPPPRPLRTSFTPAQTIPGGDGQPTALRHTRPIEGEGAGWPQEPVTLDLANGEANRLRVTLLGPAQAAASTLPTQPPPTHNGAGILPLRSSAF